MKPSILASTLDTLADECHDAPVPADPFERDAIYVAALAASREISALAKRIEHARGRRWWARRLTRQTRGQRR